MPKHDTMDISKRVDKASKVYVYIINMIIHNMPKDELTDEQWEKLWSQSVPSDDDIVDKMIAECKEKHVTQS